MPPVATLPFSEAIYNKLPATHRKKLAQATVKQYAFSSARLLSQTLKNPVVVKALPKQQFGPYINKNGQIKWWERLKLTLRHFYHALFSNYAKLSKDFAKLVDRFGKGNIHKGNSKAGLAASGTAVPSSSLGTKGTLARDFALNMGASAAGNVIGHKLTDAHNEKNAQKSGGDGGDTGVDNKDKPEDEDSLSTDGSDADENDTRSESGSDDSSVAESENESGAEHDDDICGDTGDSDGGLFGWLGGLFGGDD